MSIIPTLESLRQEDHKFEVTLGYIVKPCLNSKKSQALVVHIYNPSYSGGRDQENQDSKPAWAK
jgi:hypothetical protein